jgi:outer membrane immunogenic protein
MKKILLAAAFVVAGAGFAQAADPPMEIPVVPDPVFDWSGFYVGIFGGGGAGNAFWLPDGAVVGFDDPISGGLLGVKAGGQKQIGKFVLGVEGDVAWSGISGSVACPNPIFTCTTDIDWLASATGKAGIAAGKALLYVQAGVGAGGITTTTASPAATGTTTGTGFGLVVGAGVQVAVTEHVSLEGEYSFYHLTHNTGPGLVGPPASITPSIHTFTVGVNWHP